MHPWAPSLTDVKYQGVFMSCHLPVVCMIIHCAEDADQQMPACNKLRHTCSMHQKQMCFQAGTYVRRKPSSQLVAVSDIAAAVCIKSPPTG